MHPFLTWSPRSLSSPFGSIVSRLTFQHVPSLLEKWHIFSILYHDKKCFHSHKRVWPRGKSIYAWLPLFFKACQFLDIAAVYSEHNEWHILNISFFSLSRFYMSVKPDDSQKDPHDCLYNWPLFSSISFPYKFHCIMKELEPSPIHLTPLWLIYSCYQWINKLTSLSCLSILILCALQLLKYFLKTVNLLQEREAGHLL